jgi:hypothetical protein
LYSEAARHFKEKSDNVWKTELMDLQQTEQEQDLYRGANEFEVGYQPRSNLVKHENADLLADSHNILSRCENYSQLLNCSICLTNVCVGP